MFTRARTLTAAWLLCTVAGCCCTQSLARRQLADVRYAEGVALYEQGDYRGAIAEYDAAIEMNPSHAWAYNGRGLAWSELGEFDRAISDH